MGEYARSAAIARAVSARWPGASIHFVLSRAAPYAQNPPFAHTLLPSSATFHSGAVRTLLHGWRPHVVIFDNAGRGSQLKAAQRAGARIIYISSRRRQRAKAFRWRWMRMIDEHWIAYPRFIAGGLGFFERLKLKLLRRPTVRYLDVILTPGAAQRRAALLAQTACTAGGFLLVVPGGGTGHPGARDAIGHFYDAAQRLAALGVPTVYVGPAPADTAAGAGAAPHLHAVGALAQADLAELMSCARVIVTNGGSTLLQAIACGAACIAAPIARDQTARIRRCVQAQAALASALDGGCIAATAAALWNDEPGRAALARRAAALGLTDGLATAVAALGRFIDPAT